MKLTFDPSDKNYSKKEPHALDLELVPLLMLGSKPASRNDGEISMRTSSPPPPDTPSTPVKSSKKPQNTQVRVCLDIIHSLRPSLEIVLYPCST